MGPGGGKVAREYNGVERKKRREGREIRARTKPPHCCSRLARDFLHRLLAVTEPQAKNR